MPEHFTLNTVSAAFFCNKCGKMTQHRIDHRRKGPCPKCIAKLNSQYETRKAKTEQPSQGDLFHA